MEEVTTKPGPVKPLTYNSITIRDRNEMLSLTDMWRAAGRDPQKAPAKWRDLPSVQEFCGYVASTIGKSDSELFQALNENGEWNTWAYWQIAFAYAKYLSPEFHVWCNNVVRAYMESKLRPVLTEREQLRHLAFECLELIKKVEENREDAEALRRIEGSEGNQNITDVAKLLVMKRKDLIKWGRDNRWWYRRLNKKELVGYDYHIKNGDLEQELVEFGGKDGKIYNKEQLYVTMQGITKLARIFANIAA